MPEVIELDRSRWENYELEFSYSTDGYYSFEVHDWNFELVFHRYGDTRKKSFKDRLFGEWCDNPVAFGAFEDGKLAGVVEGFVEAWNNRFRITNLLVFEGYRGRGIGTQLMNRAVQAAVDAGVRMVVLETQTCNRNAIEFYIRMGFNPVGFDLYCYSNDDPEKTEVRLEMAKRIAS